MIVATLTCYLLLTTHHLLLTMAKVMLATTFGMCYPYPYPYP